MAVLPTFKSLEFKIWGGGLVTVLKYIYYNADDITPTIIRIFWHKEYVRLVVPPWISMCFQEYVHVVL